MNRHWISATLGVSVLVLLAATPAAAAQPFYVKVTGAAQGVIEGDVTLQGREGTIEGLEYHHLVEIPLDPASGQPAGRARHQVVIFSKRVDKATVNLWRALDSGENLTEVEFRFYRPNQSGSSENYYKVTLRDAKVVALEPITPQVRDPQFDQYSDHERVRLSYRTINVEYLPQAEEHTLSAVDPGA